MRGKRVGPHADGHELARLQGPDERRGRVGEPAPGDAEPRRRGRAREEGRVGAAKDLVDLRGHAGHVGRGEVGPARETHVGHRHHRGPAAREPQRHAAVVRVAPTLVPLVEGGHLAGRDAARDGLGRRDGTAQVAQESGREGLARGKRERAHGAGLVQAGDALVRGGVGAQPGDVGVVGDEGPGTSLERSGRGGGESRLGRGVRRAGENLHERVGTLRHALGPCEVRGQDACQRKRHAGRDGKQRRHSRANSVVRIRSRPLCARSPIA